VDVSVDVKGVARPKLVATHQKPGDAVPIPRRSTHDERFAA
jgi:hypothetical protein